jgi:hypothetical protein
VSHDPPFRGNTRPGDASPKHPPKGPPPEDRHRKLAEAVWYEWSRRRRRIAEIAAAYRISPAEVGRLLFKVDEGD